MAIERVWKEFKVPISSMSDLEPQFLIDRAELLLDWEGTRVKLSEIMIPGDINWHRPTAFYWRDSKKSEARAIRALQKGEIIIRVSYEPYEAEN